MIKRPDPIEANDNSFFILVADEAQGMDKGISAGFCLQRKLVRGGAGLECSRVAVLPGARPLDVSMVLARETSRNFTLYTATCLAAASTVSTNM